MLKTMNLEGEICANCAAKIQTAIEKMPGVNSASVNALTYRFTLDAEDDNFPAILEKSVKVFEDVEPDCEVVI